MTETLRVLVCGGRDYQGRDKVFRTLSALMGEATEEHPMGTIQLVVIHGDCPTGADCWAEDFVHVYWTQVMRFPADWADLSHDDCLKRWSHKHGWYDARAGFRRNQKMIDEGKPDQGVAFPGGPGTADMVRRLKKAGIPVTEVGR
jgi:hypothetical protein